MVKAEEAVRNLDGEIITLVKALASYRQTEKLPAAKTPSGSPHDPK
jgi:hypothetical protein